MVIESSYSQQLKTGSCPKPDKTNPNRPKLPHVSSHLVLRFTSFSAHPIFPDLIIIIIFDEGCKLWISSLYNLLRLPITSPLVLLLTLLSKTVSLCTSLNGRDQVSHSYEAASKIMNSIIFRQQTRKQKTNVQQAFSDFNLSLISSRIQILICVLPKYRHFTLPRYLLFLHIINLSSYSTF
jgi:hypothetical protein